MYCELCSSIRKMKANHVSRTIPTIIFIIVINVLHQPSFACQKRTREKEGPFKFNYADGSFYLQNGYASNFSNAMSVIGCTNMTEPYLIRAPNSTFKKNRELELINDLSQGTCASIFFEKDCKGPQFLPRARNLDIHPAYFEEIVKSFHLCSWKPPIYTDTNEQRSSLYSYSSLEDAGCSSFLLQYQFWELKECENLEKVSSVCSITSECLILYERKDCEGASQVFTRGQVINYDAKVPKWGDKARSIKSCGTFLHGRVLAIKVISTGEDIDGEVNRVDEMKTFVNTKNYDILQLFQGKLNFMENFTFNNIEGIKSLYSLKIEPNKLHIDGLEHPEEWVKDMQVDSLRKELKKAYQFHTPNRALERVPWKTKKLRKFQVKKWLNVPACSRYNITSSLELNKNLNIRFELGLEIFGETRNQNMTANEIKQKLPKGMTYVTDLDQFKILAKVEGKIRADLGTGMALKIDVVQMEPSICQGKETMPTTTAESSKPGSTTEVDQTTSTERSQVKGIGGGGDVPLQVFLLKHINFCIIVALTVLIVVIFVLCWAILRRRDDDGERPEYTLVVIGNCSFRCRLN